MSSHTPCAEGCPGWFTDVDTVEVHRCDDCARFADDTEALEFVVSSPATIIQAVAQLRDSCGMDGAGERAFQNVIFLLGGQHE